MNEEFIVFRRRDDRSIVYLSSDGVLTEKIRSARRFAYHSEAIRVAEINDMKVREL